MEILVIIAISWTIFIFWMEIRKNKKKGIFFVVFILVGAALASFGKRLGFDGEIAALIFAVFVVVIYFIKESMVKP